METRAKARKRSEEESFARIDEFSRVHVLFLPEFDRAVKTTGTRRIPKTELHTKAVRRRVIATQLPDLGSWVWYQRCNRLQELL